MVSIKKRLGRFELNSILLLITTAFAGIAGYIYQIILANILSVQDYGQANALVTYIGMGTMVIQPIGILTNRNIVIYKAEQKESELEIFLAVILEIAVSVCILTGMAVLCAGWIKKGSFGSDSNIVYFMAVLCTNILYHICMYIVQGFKQFGKYGIVGLVYAVVKVVAIMLGSRVSRDVGVVMLCLAASNVICIILLLLPGRKDNILRKYERQNILEWIPRILPFYGWAFIIQFSLNFISNGGDLILVRQVFSDEMSGIYAVASNLCRVSMIVISPVTAIMFTEVAGCLGNKIGLRKIVHKSMLYCGVLVGVYLLLLNTLGSWIVDLLYGVRYTEAASFLGETSFFFLGIVLINIFCQYYLASGRFSVIVIAMAFIVSADVMLTRFALGIEYMLTAFALVNAIAIIGIMIKMHREWKSGDEG